MSTPFPMVAGPITNPAASLSALAADPKASIDTKSPADNRPSSNNAMANKLWVSNCTTEYYRIFPQETTGEIKHIPLSDLRYYTEAIFELVEKNQKKSFSGEEIGLCYRKLDEDASPLSDNSQNGFYSFSMRPGVYYFYFDPGNNSSTAAKKMLYEDLKKLVNGQLYTVTECSNGKVISLTSDVDPLDTLDGEVSCKTILKCVAKTLNIHFSKTVLFAPNAAQPKTGKLVKRDAVLLNAAATDAVSPSAAAKK